MVLVGDSAFCLGDAAGGDDPRPAGAGFRLVCISLQNQRGLFFDHDPGADLRGHAAVLSQRNRLWWQQRVYRFHHAAGLFGDGDDNAYRAVSGDRRVTGGVTGCRFCAGEKQIWPHSDGSA
ncbi:hypothetical protein D3C76_1591350 [compost metagenome]